MNVITDEKIVEVTDEMTLRDYFAAKAMQAKITDSLGVEQIASHAYEIADAMLKEREK